MVISKHTQDMVDAVCYLQAEECFVKDSTVFKNCWDGYSLGDNVTSNTLCMTHTYMDFIEGLSNHAGEDAFADYLSLLNDVCVYKGSKFEHGEELNLEHYKSLVVYIADCTAYKGFCIVLINNTPERVNKLYLSRPETQAQIEAKKRDVTINKMVSVVGMSLEEGFSGTPSQAEECCTALYDADYRHFNPVNK